MTELHAQEANHVAALLPDLETHAWIATSNYLAVLAFGNNFATNAPIHTVQQENLKLSFGTEYSSIPV